MTEYYSGGSSVPRQIEPKQFLSDCSCRSPNLYVRQSADGSRWSICCGFCGLKGPIKISKAGAINAWNAYIKDTKDA